ncbi:hypothetical protein AAG570_003700 [Ranatra chinensis]|uniref:Uncharacterized protein n=1 Tax=Ranatra chinensis TaxID=642074 RepID=A0ABD0Y4H2_9HEMI
MASKCRNIFYENKKQETTEIDIVINRPPPKKTIRDPPSHKMTTRVRKDEELGDDRGAKTKEELVKISRLIDEETKQLRELCEQQRAVKERAAKTERGDHSSDTDSDDEIIPTVSLANILLNTTLPSLKSMVHDCGVDPKKTSIEDVRFHWDNARLQDTHRQKSLLFLILVTRRLRDTSGTWTDENCRGPVWSTAERGLVHKAADIRGATYKRMTCNAITNAPRLIPQIAPYI